MDPSTTPGSAIGSSSSSASSNEYGIGGVTLTASEVSAIAARLSASIDPSLMKLRTVGGGKQAAYLPADEIFGVANESFGFHRWACNIKDLKLMHATREDSGQWTIAYMCTMRVTFFDNGKPICFHEDVGYGTAERQPRADAAFELAVKSAVTDARKRCLRLFGPILGQNINSADFQKAAQDSAKISAHNIINHINNINITKEEEEECNNRVVHQLLEPLHCRLFQDLLHLHHQPCLPLHHLLLFYHQLILIYQYPQCKMITLVAQYLHQLLFLHQQLVSLVQHFLLLQQFNQE
jgi:DNA recombination protein Rad52